MIATLFFQYAAVANRRRQAFGARFNDTANKQNYKTLLGIGAALAIHIASLTLLPKHQSETPITPPHPIIVNWVDSAVSDAPNPPAAKPLPQPERPIKQPKPKPVAKVAKAKPVLAAASEPEPQAALTASTAVPQSAAASAASLDQVAETLGQRRDEEPFSHMTYRAIDAARHHAMHGVQCLQEAGSAGDFLTRAIRRVIDEETAKLE